MDRTVVAMVAVALAACSSASSTTGGAPTPAPAPAPAVVPAVPPPPPAVPTPPPRDTVSAVNPEGNYELQLVFGGTPVPVAMELYKENGVWRGTVGNSSLGSADVTGLVQDGRKFRVTMSAATGEAFTLDFELKPDNSVVGTWAGNGDGSQVTGRKVR